MIRPTSKFDSTEAKFDSTDVKLDSTDAKLDSTDAKFDSTDANFDPMTSIQPTSNFDPNDRTTFLESWKSRAPTSAPENISGEAPIGESTFGI